MTAVSPAPFYGGYDVGVPFQTPMAIFDTDGPSVVWNPPQDNSWYVLQKADVVFTDSAEGSTFQLLIDYSGTLVPFHSGQTGAGTLDHFPWYGPLALLHGQVVKIELFAAAVGLTISGIQLPQFNP